MLTRSKKSDGQQENKTIVVTNKSPMAQSLGITTRSTNKKTATKSNVQSTRKLKILTPIIQKRRNNATATVESVKKKLFLTETSQNPDTSLRKLRSFTNVKVSLPRMPTEVIAKSINKPVKKITPIKSTKQKNTEKSVKIVLNRREEDTNIKLQLEEEPVLSTNRRNKSNRSEKQKTTKELPEVVAEPIKKFNEIHKKVAKKQNCQIKLRRLSKDEISSALSGDNKNPIKKRDLRKKKIDQQEEKKVAGAIKQGILKLASSASPSKQIPIHTPIYKNKLQKPSEAKSPQDKTTSVEIITNDDPTTATNNNIFDYFSNSQEFSDDDNSVEKNEMKRVIEKLCREKKVVIKHKLNRKQPTGGKVKPKLAGVIKKRKTILGDKGKNIIVERQLKTLKESLQSTLLEQKKQISKQSSSVSSENEDNSGELELEIPNTVPMPTQELQQQPNVPKLPIMKFFHDFSANSEISMLSPIATPSNAKKMTLVGTNNAFSNSKPQPKRISLMDKNKILQMLNKPISQSTPIRVNSTVIEIEKKKDEKPSSSEPVGIQSPWRFEIEEFRKLPLKNKNPKTITTTTVGISTAEKCSPIKHLPIVQLDSTVKSATQLIQIPIRLTFSHNEETPQILSDTSIGLSNIENCDPEDTPLILLSPVKPLAERPVGRSPLKTLPIGIDYNLTQDHGSNILTFGMKSNSNYYQESPLVRTYQNTKMKSPHKTTFDVPSSSSAAIESSKSISNPKLPDLFGFESDIEDETSNENSMVIRTPQKKLLKQTNQKFKETIKEKIFPPTAAKEIIKTKKPPQVESKIKTIFKDSTMSNNEQQTKKIPELISEQQWKLNNIPSTSKAIAVTSNNEEPVQLFQPLWPEKDGYKRKSYTRIPKRKYYLSDSEETDPDSPIKNKKKRVVASRKQQLEKAKMDDELDKYAEEFNSMCDQIDKYEIPVEVIGNSS